MILIFFLKVLQRFFGFLEYVLSPGEQLGAKVFALALVHKRLLVGRPIIFRFGQHPTYSLIFFVGRVVPPPPSGRLIYVRQPADNIRLLFPRRPEFGDSSRTSRKRVRREVDRVGYRIPAFASSTATRRSISPNIRSSPGSPVVSVSPSDATFNRARVDRSTLPSSKP